MCLEQTTSGAEMLLEKPIAPEVDERRCLKVSEPHANGLRCNAPRMTNIIIKVIHG
jgi:hypothetical protein